MAAANPLDLNQPNLELPLASSYNPRGIAAFTNAVTNSLDQKKVNGFYRLIQNSQTGKGTLYLCKRPGVADLGSTYGSGAQVAYQWEVAPGATSNTAANYWVFSTSGNDQRASNSSGTTTTIQTAAGYVPAFVDKTHLSGTENLVVQLRRTSDGDQRVYYSTAIATFTEITDADFTGLTHTGKMEFMDGYAFVMDAATNSIFNSDLNSLANWTATSFIRKQIHQDISLGLAKLGNQIIAFGQGTYEVFRNAGLASGSPLETIPQLANKGAGLFSASAAQPYYAEVGGRIYWFGTGPNGVYSFDGSRSEKVSTASTDAILAENQPTAVCPLGAGAQKGVAFALDARTATTQRWLIFFPDLNEWFEWNSTVFQPITSQRSSNVFLGVGSNDDKLYQISSTSDNWQDAGTNYDHIHQFAIPIGGRQLNRMYWCGLECDIERSAATTSVQFSDDDGQTWSSARTIDRTSIKPYLHACGSFRRRLVRLTNASNHEGRIEKFLARIG